MDDMSDRVRMLEIRMTSHEAVCAERYAGLNKSVTSVDSKISATNRLLLGVGGTVMLQLLAFIMYLADRVP